VACHGHSLITMTGRTSIVILSFPFSLPPDSTTLKSSPIVLSFFYPVFEVKQMSVAVTVDAKDGSTYVVTVKGTAAEVGSELATGTEANSDTTGTQWDGSKRSFMGFGGSGTTWTAVYLSKLLH